MINHLQSCFHSHSLLPTHQPTQQHILFSFQKHSHSLIPICLYSLLLEDSFPTNTQEYLLNSLVALIIHIPFEKYSIHPIGPLSLLYSSTPPFTLTYHHLQSPSPVYLYEYPLLLGRTTLALKTHKARAHLSFTHYHISSFIIDSSTNNSICHSITQLSP